MAVDIDNLWIYRIISIQNLEHNLRHGLFCKKKCLLNKDYVEIGSKEIISQRDRTVVKCYPDTVVNDFVPFCFSVRTPMLYNVKTGHGVPMRPQSDIVYLCCKLADLVTDNFVWCYTDGNAAKAITKFFSNLSGIDDQIDWHAINTTDFKDNNSDHDEDRKRKKHAEFLVKDHVPADMIKEIVVLNKEKEMEVNAMLSRLKMNIKVVINPGNKYYF